MGNVFATGFKTRERNGVVWLTFVVERRPALQIVMTKESFEEMRKCLGKTREVARLCGTELCPLQQSIFTIH